MLPLFYPHPYPPAGVATAFVKAKARTIIPTRNAEEICARKHPVGLIHRPWAPQ